MLRRRATDLPINDEIGLTVVDFSNILRRLALQNSVVLQLLGEPVIRIDAPERV